MKNIKFMCSKIVLLLGLVFVTVASCERPVSDEVEFASYATTGEIFIDGFEGGLDYFPFGGSFADAFAVETDVTYKGEASMRFDIPSFGVGYGGATFPSTGPRDLSNYDALTFWAKASQGADINEIGFGIDADGSKFKVTMNNLAISTKWTKYIIPIPDPSKLIQEIGMFWYAEGAENADDEGGYNFWIDELRFEKLGTIAQPRPAMLNGADVTEQIFAGTIINLADRGLTQTYNLASGVNQTVKAAPSYFTFTSSDVDVARVSELGVVSIVGSGTAKITASMAGVNATGSLTLETLGTFDEAPTPTKSANDVISIFSDAYTNVAVDYYNGFFNGDGQTTLGGAPPANLGAGQVINYTDLNFVGIGTFLNVPTINATAMTHLHVDINVQEAVDSNDFIRLQLLNSVGNNETSGAFTISSSQLKTEEWVSLDIPLTDFSGLGSKNEIGLLFFISDTTISNIFVDNIYFYKQ